MADHHVPSLTPFLWSSRVRGLFASSKIKRSHTAMMRVLLKPSGWSRTSRTRAFETAAVYRGCLFCAPLRAAWCSVQHTGPSQIHRAALANEVATAEGQNRLGLS